MIFEKSLLPDRLFGSFREVTPDILSEMGVKALLCDIDNTLVTYDDPEPTPDVARWFGQLKEAGIGVAFISNNEPERVELFNRSLGYPAYPKAGKPSTKAYAEAAAALGVPREACAVLGDQLLTDAWAAHRFGVPALIVPPIKDKTSLFFRFKRSLEVPYMKKARRLGR
jgi:hypothetical protein